MNAEQKNIINNIIEYLINTSANYENKIDENRLKAITEEYEKLEKANFPIKKEYYPQITNLIDSQIAAQLRNKEKRQNIQEWIMPVTERIVEKTKNPCLKNTIYFISTYIENHIITYSSMLFSIEETATDLSKYSEVLKESKNELKEAKGSLDSLLPNLLTVLSILISIIIAVVIVYITIFLESNADSTVINQYIQTQFAKYVLSVHVVGDLFFLMMFIIARLTNRTILIKCGDFKWRPNIDDKDKDTYTTNFHYSACADCVYKCSNFKKVYNKSAYIVYYNLLMFVLYAILYYWWILDYYVKEQRNFLYTSDFWFVISFVALFVLVMIVLIVHKIKSKHEQQDIELLCIDK